MRTRRGSPGVLGAAVVIAFLLHGPSAEAAVERYALLIGANQGYAHEPPLRYAESDVDAVAATLETVAGFASNRIVRVKNADADRVRGALVDLGLAMQREVPRDGDALLFVFYSGHGSAGELHLRGTSLSTDEFSKLVRLSPARLKLLLVDACRSGTLTRVKGGRQVAPFQIGIADQLHDEGYAIITSSAAGEDAQESDGLRSSVFTHHFMSALRGLGDSNQDRLVTLGEAYAYAYSQSLRASMTTVVGSQHATFDYDLRGRADPVLADLRGRDDLATLILAERGDYLIEPGDGTGAAGIGSLIEAHVDTPRTALTIPAAPYRIRFRTPERVMQADVRVERGRTLVLASGDMRALPLAQVIRKGEVAATLATGPSVTAAIHGPVGAGFSPTIGAQIGWGFDLPVITLMPRVSFGHGQSERLGNTAVASHDLSELTAEAAALYVIDVGPLSIAPLLSIGAAFLFQDIDLGTGGPHQRARPIALVTSLGAALSLPLGRGFAFEAGAEMVSFYLPRANDPQLPDQQALRTGTLTYRASLGIGYRY